MRVLLVDDDPDRAAVVRDSLCQMGAEIAAQIGLDADLRAAIARTTPDLIVVDLDCPYRDYLEDLMQINRENPRPIAMFVGEEDRALMAQGVQAGVSVYAVDGLSPKLVRSIMETVLGHFHRFRQLNEELEKSRTALSDRKQVDRAKGLLMTHRGLSEDDAYRYLRKLAMDQNKRLADIAETVIAMADLLKR